MKLECSIDLKNCICERNFCRKSESIHPQSELARKSYHQTQAAYISKHSHKPGACLLILLFCAGFCCIFLPICGLWIGPLLYYIKSLNPTPYPTLAPTQNLTIEPEMYMLRILNDTLQNVSNISIKY